VAVVVGGGYLREVLRAAQGEMVQARGGAGFGRRWNGRKEPEALDDLEQALFTNPAVAGEAAGYAVVSSCSGLPTPLVRMGCLLTHGNPIATSRPSTARYQNLCR